MAAPVHPVTFVAGTLSIATLLAVFYWDFEAGSRIVHWLSSLEFAQQGDKIVVTAPKPELKPVPLQPRLRRLDDDGQDVINQ